MSHYQCKKPGCKNRVEVYGCNWCPSCYYPSIDRDYERYQAYREDGYGAYQSALMVGWADPPEGDD